MNSPPTSYRGYAREEQVTGEGVAVELPVASVPARMLARIIDLVLTAILLLLLFLVSLLLSWDFSGAVQRTLALLAVIGVVVVFPTVFETWTRGKSVGKYVMGLRTVRDDGGPVTSRQALVRALTAPIELITLGGGPALICALVTQRAKRLGDMAAGTYVIAERHKVRITPVMLPAHPVLAAWAAHADIAVIPTGLALAVRQFLLRSHTLTPQARDQIGRDLLAQVLTHVSPAPPTGWHAEYVLAAVLADRRRRDADRLRRDQRLRDRVLSRGTDEATR